MDEGSADTAEHGLSFESFGQGARKVPMEVRDFTYTIQPMTSESGFFTVAGGYSVIYHDADTGAILGGWDTVQESEEEIDRIIEKNRDKLLSDFRKHFVSD